MPISDNSFTRRYVVFDRMDKNIGIIYATSKDAALHQAINQTPNGSSVTLLSKCSDAVRSHYGHR